MTLEGLIWFVVYVLIAFAVAGILTWIIRAAPSSFIPDAAKQWLVWIVWALVALIFLLWLVRSIGPGTRLW